MLRTAFVAAVAGSAAAFAPAGPVSLPRVLAPATGLAARLSAAAAPAPGALDRLFSAERLGSLSRSVRKPGNP